MACKSILFAPRSERSVFGIDYLILSIARRSFAGQRDSLFLILPMSQFFLDIYPRVNIIHWGGPEYVHSPEIFTKEKQEAIWRSKKLS